MNRYPGNHMDSGIVTVPRQLKTRPGAPQTHLAYITGDEAKMIQEHKPGTPHEGAAGIPNYDTWGIDTSGNVTGGSTADGGDSWSGDTGGGSWGGGEDWGPGGGSNEGGSTNNNWNYNNDNDYVEPYIHHDDYYTDPLPEDIPWSSDDEIADYSFSTPDVRSSLKDKYEFRKRIADAGGSGWAHKTEAEKLAEVMYDITNNPNYLNQPLFIPKDADWDEIWGNLDEAAKAGNAEIFFESLEGLEDITAGNPNTQYFDAVSGTGWDDWWRRPTVSTGVGNDDGGGRGYNWGSSNLNYGNLSGYGKYANWGKRPFMTQSFDSPMPQYYASLKNPGQPTNIAKFNNMMGNMYNSGIRSLG